MIKFDDNNKPIQDEEDEVFFADTVLPYFGFTLEGDGDELILTDSRGNYSAVEWDEIADIAGKAAENLYSMLLDLQNKYRK